MLLLVCPILAISYCLAWCAARNWPVRVQQKAVLIDGSKPYVWVEENGVAHRRDITQSGVCQSGVVVSSGLSQGDKVIVNGQNKVSEGVKVI